ncbi:pyocin knob domain-containing protein [Bacillus cytotoxicus]
MPEFTERLKLPLPLGNEYVKREMSNNIFKEIDKKVATLEECNMVLSDAKKYVDNGWKQKYQVTEEDGTAVSLNDETDLNTVLNTGFYRGYKLKNAPTGDYWHYLMVTKHTQSYVMQIASVLDRGFDKDKNTLFIRHLINKAWSTWRALSLREDWGKWRTNGIRDLLVYNKRALVGYDTEDGDKLVINYGNDFKNGVDVQGRLTNDGKSVLHTGYNLMKDLEKEILMQDDWNTIISTGIYRVSTDNVNPVHSNAPKGAYPYGTLEVYQASNGYHIFQRYTSHEKAEVWIRAGWQKGKWTAWRKLADENIVNTRLSLSGGTVTGDITLKGKDYNIETPVSTSGWARGLRFYSSDGKTDFGGIGLYGVGSGSQYMYMSASPSPWGAGNGLFVYKDGTIKAKGNLTFNDKKVATVDDVNNTQTKKITNDNGSQTISVVDSSQNILNEILAKGAGLNTIYCNGGVQGQTPANVSWRGISFLNQSDIGFVLAKDYKGNFWTNYINGKHGWLGWTEHPNSEQVIDEINKRTEDGVPSRSGKDENGIYTVYEEAQEDGKLRKKSVLSNPDADGNYLVRTVNYYENGVAYKTMVFDLKYDEDGDFIKAVPRK